MIAGISKYAVITILALLAGGCSATYIPISWGLGEKVQQLSRSDLTLVTLFNRYDPQRQTLRVAGDSFDEVMMPDEVEHHLGAYRQDTKLIYRNLYQQFNDNQLRDLMAHELAHHIWFFHMSPEQRAHWRVHLDMNPTPLQDMVRKVYRNPADHETEDFAFTVQKARPVDIEELSWLKIITPQERDALLKEHYPQKLAGEPQNSARLSTGSSDLSQNVPQLTNKGTDSVK